MGHKNLRKQSTCSVDFAQTSSKSEIKLNLSPGLFLLFWNVIIMNVCTICFLWCAHQKEVAFGCLLMMYTLFQLFFASLLYRGEVKRDCLYQRSAIMSHLPGFILGLLLLIHMPANFSMNLSWLCKVIIIIETCINGTTLFNTISTLFAV